MKRGNNMTCKMLACGFFSGRMRGTIDLWQSGVFLPGAQESVTFLPRPDRVWSVMYILTCVTSYMSSSSISVFLSLVQSFCGLLLWNHQRSLSPRAHTSMFLYVQVYASMHIHVCGRCTCIFMSIHVHMYGCTGEFTRVWRPDSIIIP